MNNEFKDMSTAPTLTLDPFQAQEEKKPPVIQAEEQGLNDSVLTEEERRIVQEFYINGKNEREACAALGLPKTTFRRREQRLREKLGILLKNFL